MILYAAQPNNFVPRLINDLRNTFKKNEEISIEFFKDNAFSQVYSFWNNKFLTLDELLNNFKTTSFPINLNNFLKNKDNNFVSGILNADHIEKNKNDYFFTIISNPVDRLYEMYFFLQSIIKNNTALKIEEKIINFFVPNIKRLSLNEFIDFFLDKKGNIENSNIKLCNNLFLQFKRFEKLNFIGLKENLCESLVYLNNTLNINLKINDYKKFLNTGIQHNYRRSEVENLMNEDILNYNLIKKLFVKKVGL